MKLLISGAGIAGPALALAMKSGEHDVTVVERAAALRDGGQAVDFRGPVHREVLERMDLWDGIWERKTAPASLAFIDQHERVKALLPSVLTAGDVEIVRGDLTRLLYERTKPFTTYRFGDHIVALNESGEGAVSVRFASGREDSYDLVVGADGLHSGVRALKFGEEARFVKHHGYGLATFSFEGEVKGDTLSYAERGRSITLSHAGRGRSRALLIFTSEPLGRGSAAQHLATIRERFANAAWRTPEILEAMDRATDLYVDSIATVHVDRYSEGRVALLGDAAWGGTLGGQGTPLAIVGAYVLANELRIGPDVRTALERYESRMRPYATGCQKIAKNAGPFHAPRTGWGLTLRDLFHRAMTSRLLVKQFEKMVKADASDFELPAYAESHPTPETPRSAA